MCEYVGVKPICEMKVTSWDICTNGRPRSSERGLSLSMSVSDNGLDGGGAEAWYYYYVCRDYMLLE